MHAVHSFFKHFKLVRYPQNHFKLIVYKKQQLQHPEHNLEVNYRISKDKICSA